MDTEQIFKALADENRRKLLDMLFERDGQTLFELEAYLDMTRFGTMKHLQILEDAGLLTTRKVGREKFHYLNPVPIQQVYDRWVSKYAQPYTQTLVGLKQFMEKQMMPEKPAHVYQIFIRTTAEKLWQALTDGNMTQQYYFGSRVESSWQAGAPYQYLSPAGEPFINGDVIECDPPHKLVTTFVATWDGDKNVSNVTWEIEQVGDNCKLTMTHTNLQPDTVLTKGIIGGWSQIISGLKTLLETGQPLVMSE